jgi:ComF family protein
MPLSGIKHFLVGLKDDILDFVYPQSCPICQRPLARDESFACKECWQSLSILPASFCPYCRCYFGSDESKVEHVCPCLDRPEERSILAVRSLGAFDDSYQKLIHRFKYDKRVPLGRRLAKRLAQRLVQGNDFVNCDLVIPVPLHRARRRERGFNQSQVLAEGISETTNVPLAGDILKRKKNTKDQTHLNAQERAENVRDAFTVTDAANLDGKNVILVDDVMTTGATLNECARILREAGAARIIAATLAVVVH